MINIIETPNYGLNKVLKVTTQSSRIFFLKITTNALSKSQKNKESAVCQFIKQRLPGFPCVVPEMLFVQNKVAAYIEPAIQGNPIGQCIDEIHVVQRAYQELADHLLALHSLTLPDSLIKTLPPREEDWTVFVKNLFWGYIHEITQKQYLNTESIDLIKKYWSKCECCLEPSVPLALVHNDLDQANIIVNPCFNGQYNNNILTGVIDFERCLLGDPVKDISKLVWAFKRSRDAQKFFTENYFSDIDNLIKSKIKLYFVCDMLNHIRQQDYLSRFPIWVRFIEEEKALLIELLERDDDRLW